MSTEMNTDSKFNDFLAETASKAAAGELTLQLAKERIDRMARHLSQFETPATAERVDIVEDGMARQLRRQFTGYNDCRSLVFAEVARRGRLSRKDVEKNSTIREAILAMAGGSDGFSSVMLDRLKNLDSSFFKTVGTAIEIVKRAKLSRKLDEIGANKNPMGVFADHLFHTLCTVMEIRHARMPLPDNYTMVTIVCGWVGDSSYMDQSDWRKVWRAAGIELKQQQTGRGRVDFNSAYRRFEKPRP
jgi:hypothetical protein